MAALRSIAQLAPSNRKNKTLTVIIETPKGSRNKFTFDEQHELFKLGGVLPAGAVFPFDFGFIPSTRGEHGDPLDVLLLMDEPAFPGCLIEARLLGVIEAEQSEEEETVRNDRLVAVAAEAHTHRDVESLDDLPEQLLEEIEHFFVSYNEFKGKRFRPLGRFGADRARKLVDEGVRAAALRKKQKTSKGRKRSG